jgi:hypothetical protein
VTTAAPPRQVNAQLALVLLLLAAFIVRLLVLGTHGHQSDIRFGVV